MRFILLLPLLFTGSAIAAEKVLCTDSLQPNDPAFFQGGFAVADEAAVRFTAPADAELVKVLMLWGGGDFIGEGFTETLRVYDDTGVDLFEQPGFPGERVYEGDAPLIASDTEATEVAVSPAVDVALLGRFWVSLAFRHNGFPGVARDEDYNGKSAIFAVTKAGTGWVENDILRVGGDWIIRAVVETDEPIDDSNCRFDGAVVGEGEGEVVGEGEGEGVGEGEGEVVGEGEEEAELTITSITPSTIPVGATPEVVVLGTGFGIGTTFRVGPSSLNAVTISNDGAARGTLPSLGVGSYDVVAQQGAAVFVLPSALLVTPVDLAPTNEPTGCGCGASPGVMTGWGAAAWLLWRRRRNTG
jgi:hypothetical protein